LVEKLIVDYSGELTLKDESKIKKCSHCDLKYFQIEILPLLSVWTVSISTMGVIAFNRKSSQKGAGKL
jgi:hypothetical protein